MPSALAMSKLQRLYSVISVTSNFVCTITGRLNSDYSYIVLTGRRGPPREVKRSTCL